jgi:hypothetical protein
MACATLLKRKTTEIKFACSLVCRDDIGAFLEAMRQGIYSIKQCFKEQKEGGETAGCVTIIIPTDEDDVYSCNSGCIAMS